MSYVNQDFINECSGATGEALSCNLSIRLNDSGNYIYNSYNMLDYDLDRPEEEENSGISPMFNSLVPSTPNEKNGFIIVKQHLDDKKNDEPKKIIYTDRQVTESLLDYMGNALNYFKTYYL